MKKSELSPRLAREYKTVEAMIRIHCNNNHKTDTILCNDCSELENYALGRLLNCKFKKNKPTCGKCTIHCYRPAMQEKIRKVMKYSGPRMIFYHPVLALCHLLDGLLKRSSESEKTK